MDHYYYNDYNDYDDYDASNCEYNYVNEYKRFNEQYYDQYIEYREYQYHCSEYHESYAISSTSLISTRRNILQLVPSRMEGRRHSQSSRKIKKPSSRINRIKSEPVDSPNSEASEYKLVEPDNYFALKCLLP